MSALGAAPRLRWVAVLGGRRPTSYVPTVLVAAGAMHLRPPADPGARRREPDRMPVST